MKLLVIALLIAILVSLGFGLFYLTRERDNPRKLLRSLQIRIALTLGLVSVLVLAYVFGVIVPPTGP